MHLPYLSSKLQLNLEQSHSTGSLLHANGETDLKALLLLGRFALRSALIVTAECSYQPLLSAAPPPTTVSVLSYGALCDGVTNDTAAIQAALNSGYTVQIPQGVCVITAPVVIDVSSNFSALEGTSGNNSVILADYSRWHGTDPTALELITSSPLPNVHTWSNRTFRNFSILSNDASSVQALAISAHTTSASGPGVHYSPLISSTLQNLYISGFDTALDVQEAWQSNFDNIYISDCRVGINLHGFAVNLMFSDIQMTNFSNSYTNNGGNTIGLNLTTKTYASGPLGPQGIVFSHGLIYGAYSDVNADSGLHLEINHSILDGSTDNAVVVINPNGFQLTDNWILTNANGDSCVYISSPSSNLDGLWIQGNEIVGTGTTNSQTGIYFAAGTARRGVHIADNRFSNIENPMILREVPQYSIIENNTGAQNGANPFIWLGSGGDYTSVAGNESTDSEPILTLSGTASTIHVGYNASASGTTGP